MGAPRAIALCQCFNGALEYQAGHWVEAETVLRESLRLYHELGAASGEALALQRLGTLMTARGRLDEAMALLQEGVIVAGRASMRAHCLTRLYASITRNRLMAGEIEAAAHYLALGLAMSERHGHCATCHALLYPVAVSVQLTQGNFAQAEDSCQRLEKAAREYQSQAWSAMARQARGELSAAQGDFESAMTCYDEAMQAFKATGNQYDAAQCLVAMAEIRRKRKAPEDVDRAKAEEIEARLMLQGLVAR